MNKTKTLYKVDVFVTSFKSKLLSKMTSQTYKFFVVDSNDEP